MRGEHCRPGGLGFISGLPVGTWGSQSACGAVSSSVERGQYLLRMGQDRAGNVYTDACMFWCGPCTWRSPPLRAFASMVGMGPVRRAGSDFKGEELGGRVGSGAGPGDPRERLASDSAVPKHRGARSPWDGVLMEPGSWDAPASVENPCGQTQAALGLKYLREGQMAPHPWTDWGQLAPPAPTLPSLPPPALCPCLAPLAAD